MTSNDSRLLPVHGNWETLQWGHRDLRGSSGGPILRVASTGSERLPHFPQVGDLNRFRSREDVGVSHP